MRHRYFVWVCAFVFFGAICSAAQDAAKPSSSAEQYVGTWNGSWDGGGSSGGFDLTFEKDDKGAVVGKVSVTGEPTYKATFKSMAIDGKKMTATYDFPPAEGAEVKLDGEFDGGKAKGTWSLRDKASGQEVISGGWTVAKK